jgi:hypothetical protein
MFGYYTTIPTEIVSFVLKHYKQSMVTKRVKATVITYLRFSWAEVLCYVLAPNTLYASKIGVSTCIAC